MSKLKVKDITNNWHEIAFSEEIVNKEDISNKVSSISSSSTDTQYPSAKAVYDILSHLPYLTTAPTADNPSGLGFVFLNEEPETRYNGWLYFIRLEEQA